MPYVVTESCIKCKYMDCCEVCPVDCFYEGENMLVINPDECIDCGVCEPECPAEAIIPDSDSNSEKWLSLNEEFSSKWPNIVRKELHQRMERSIKMKVISLKNIFQKNLEQVQKSNNKNHK